MVFSAAILLLQSLRTFKLPQGPWYDVIMWIIVIDYNYMGKEISSRLGNAAQAKCIKELDCLHIAIESRPLTLVVNNQIPTKHKAI